MPDDIIQSEGDGTQRVNVLLLLVTLLWMVTYFGTIVLKVVGVL